MINVETEATRIRKNKNLVKISFHLTNEDVINTNDTIKYLGKTEGYYFLWNKYSEISLIYPASEIKRIEVNLSKKTKIKKTVDKKAQFNKIEPNQ